jgi:hypothetical protein
MISRDAPVDEVLAEKLHWHQKTDLFFAVPLCRGQTVLFFHEFSTNVTT